VFSVGATPTRQLSLQPVAIGAAVEVTKPSKPSKERVALGFTDFLGVRRRADGGRLGMPNLNDAVPTLLDGTER